ncbi:ABC transporter permease, partial [Candidatus Bathyarchaeota archaeon]
SLTFVWLIPRLMPGDPIRQLVSEILVGAGEGGQTAAVGTTQFTVRQAELLYKHYVKKFGLDKPPHIQYLLMFYRIFTGDMGMSIKFQPETVLNIVLKALPWSLGLLIPATITAWVIGNLLGAYAAYKGGKTDNIVYSVFLFLSQMPYYWFALILIYALAIKIRLFPAAGAYSVGAVPTFTWCFFVDFLQHYTLPFLSLVLIALGGQAIGMRTMTIYELNSDYMDYSESIGLSDRKLIRYAFRNAILPQITGLAIHLGRTVSGQIVTETVFGYPGIGYIIYQAILNADYPLIEGAFMILIASVLLMNFLMDILYAYIDPRIKAVYTGEK